MEKPYMDWLWEFVGGLKLDAEDSKMRENARIEFDLLVSRLEKLENQKSSPQEEDEDVVPLW